MPCLFSYSCCRKNPGLNCFNPGPATHETTSETELAADPSSAALQEIVDQLAGGVVHFHVERFDAAGEVVEHHDGGNGDEQADGRHDVQLPDRKSTRLNSSHGY